MAALAASAVAPSSQHIARRTPLRRSAAAARPQRIAAPVRAVAAPERQGPIIIDGQVLHSATKEQLDVIGSMGPYAEEHVLPILKPTDKCWQPQDFLPDPESPEFFDAVGAAGGAGWLAGWPSGCMEVGRRRRARVFRCGLLQQHRRELTASDGPPLVATASPHLCLQVHELQKRTKEVPDEYFVSLVSGH